MASQKYGRNKILFTCYLEPEQREKLERLHENTKIPKAVLVREALELLFESRQDQVDLESALP